jgi:hypothetical protein
MPDYNAADELADRFFTLMAEDGRLTPELTPNEIVTIANQLIIAVLRSIDDAGRREWAANRLADKIRGLPELPIWDNAKKILH